MTEIKPSEEPQKPPDSLFDIPGAREAIEENIKKRGIVWKEEEKKEEEKQKPENPPQKKK
ncbi:hypothetical protein A2422_00695 [Candidatus Woesebacteria bacterium RIFOXYC1_FULL_31_51]|uniref:Uncharacterized protein n=1 Tax=Candidatus Woesebacteria bacterium GW2011_GWC2_31_9 TaxID=1618586 RepID=A0A0F9YLX4_9BACT|nr:MAG: hypothetical protein UR17_C0001G0548 [Candidatus Woesebacteria bacterium GW2011_GWF1_31_35]KKP22835.1 MAG: hypothetical protein UR11_C0002G0215 [Candidatus Woesebacteria bacterium GW2011_GWC1_30_29]KKP26677.1 MAG: hypothetical protein UR13_C0003G0044 [Candidatus Woesebacteria bacterium GW2011_GWD1_31_12]KKP28083.1 MAG: hypothetical protein UR16_C0001G0104 [Candidatus Woesebacteria bacterium GW2011_GWB1_31_29]KKP31166.1 MAG: hypothetical protein UR20_C0042G0005 [Candidatus Woesebacteria 